MSLRRPPAPPTKPKTWRRSGDGSNWDSLTRDPPAPRSRPQSAIEGGQLDEWLKHLERIQQTTQGGFGEPSVGKEAPCPTWRAKGGVLSSRGSSPGGTSLCGSSLGSQESLQTGVSSPLDRSEGWERARMSQAAKKEQTRVSFLTPVKIGWLPIRRKVTMVGEQGHNTDATGQVKLKQPITPLLKNAPSSAKSCSDEEVQRSQSKASAEGVRTAWQAPNQGSPTDKQIQDKRIPAVSDAPVSWQALKRGWRLNRVLALPGSSWTNKTTAGTSLERPDPKAFPQDKPDSLRRTASPDQSKDIAPAPLHRTLQPIKAPHIETTSAKKTLIPDNKAGFSSITISSRKVCRSASLPLSPPPTHESMNTNSRQVMVQRKATIVKVTQQTTTTTSPIRNGCQNVGQSQPAARNLDTVVHRRKATIIKVTEHRESFTPGNASAQQKKNEYRHSYSEGLYKENSIWSQGNHATPNMPPIDSKPIHRSTLNLIVSTPPAIKAPPPPSGNNEKSNGPQRPSSCYGNVFSSSEAIEERKAQSVTRKLSLGSTESSGVMNSDGGFNMAGVNRVKSLGQANNRGETVTPLTLIKTPDPHQTPEEVLALNAAAIIANIKLQSHLSKKKTPNGLSETHSAPASQHQNESAAQDTVKDGEHSAKAHVAAFVPLSNDTQRSTQNMSLQEALQRSRPDFISRSQRRTQELEQRAQERRRGTTRSAQPKNCSNHGTPAREKLFRHSNRAVMKKTTVPSKQSAEVKRRQEDEAKRDSSLNNRPRAELVKKKLLGQVLQRNKD